MKSYFFHPEASEEFEAAAAFYESRVSGLGIAFTTEVKRAINFIRRFPESGSVTATGEATRRMQLMRFPFSVVYMADLESIVIVAVSHHRRRPGYWRERK